MFEIKPLSESDYGFAVELANTMNWNMADEDFIFMASLESGGCFLLLDDAKCVGIATCISYGKVGWFGNLVVKEEYRKRGAGSALVTHAVNYLNTKNVETIGLYAYPHLLRFYNGLGFRPDIDFSVLHTPNLPPVSAKSLPRIDKSELPAIVRFDNCFFGGNRQKLLESILLDETNTSCYVTEDSKILGYVAATVYEKTAWIGPLICQPQRSDIALSLVKSVLTELEAKSVYTVIPKNDPVLLGLFFEVGFRKDFFVSRMFLGKNPAKNCIYLAESLERG
ncbi:MAG: GNAT family N-acetyltransferase [Nitrososphaerota archaeon]|jgi:predicted N-acetyltransferase YhbS|nr:GNAT family N-acetyltransferase [Nitrososphaerota archaeon]